MKRNYRRALLFAAILIFMATTPIVILYALGYRTSLTSADPLPVGVLLIETEPAQAKIYIDGAYLGQSPRSLSRPAGAVAIKIEKEGYTSWEKTVAIEPGRATEVRDVRLFPDTLAPATLASGVQSFSLSPSRRLLAVQLANNRFTVMDQAGETVVPSQPFLQRIEEYLWSPNSDALLIRTSGGTPWWYLPVARGGRIIPASGAAGQRGAAWDPRIPGRLLSLDVKGTLDATVITAAGNVPLITNVSQFATSANHVYIISKAGQLAEYSLQGQAAGSAVALPPGAVAQLLITPQENIAVRLDSGEVWLLRDGRTFDKIAAGIIDASWSPSGKVLLLQSDASSLYVYNVNDKRTTLPVGELRLVQRLSRPITEPHWFAGSRHVVYQAGDSLWITEIDTRDHPVSFEVDTTNLGSAEAAVGEEGETIFYLKKVGKSTNLVAASLLAQ